MAELNFCKLEVTVIHSLQNYNNAADRFSNMEAISRNLEYNGDNEWAKKIDIVNSTDPNIAIQVVFDNTELNCELKIVDSIEDEGDNFEFKVWNIPENVIFNVGDYLLFKWYWESDPLKYTTYHGIIKAVKSKRSNSDLETTIKGELVDQNILYGTGIYKKYPKLTYYSDVKDFIENELQLHFISMIPGFSQKKKLPEPILTYGKSVGVILEQLCAQLTKYVLKDANPRYPNDRARWKFVTQDQHTLLIYRDSDLTSRNSTILNEYLKLTVPSINYTDLLEFTDNGDSAYTIQLFGLPVVKAGIAMYIDTKDAPGYITSDSAYYVIDEVEHQITVDDGYIMKAYVRVTQ